MALFRWPLPWIFVYQSAVWVMRGKYAWYRCGALYVQYICIHLCTHCSQWRRGIRNPPHTYALSLSAKKCLYYNQSCNPKRLHVLNWRRKEIPEWMFMAQGGSTGGVSHTVTPAGNQAPGLKLPMHKHLPLGRTQIWPLLVQRVLQRRHSQTKVVLYGSSSDPDTISPDSGPYDEEWAVLEYTMRGLSS